MATRDEMFKTTRMALLRGVNPAYIAGQYVHLQRDVQGFLKGSRAKVVTVQVARPGEHRYLLFIEGEKIWAFEADLRPTPPGDALLATGADGNLSITQKLQSMSVSQRMATLGVNETRRLNTLGATQRMHALTPDERMQDLLATNRTRNLAEGIDAADDSGATKKPDTPGAPSGD